MWSRNRREYGSLDHGCLTFLGHSAFGNVQRRSGRGTEILVDLSLLRSESQWMEQQREKSRFLPPDPELFMKRKRGNLQLKGLLSCYGSRNIVEICLVLKYIQDNRQLQ